MCNDNTNTILSLDFANVNDEGNWLHSSTNILQTIGGQLVIDPDSATTGFVRQIGNLDATNNRIRMRCNLEVEMTDPNGPSDMSVLFQIMVAGNVIYESCAEFEGMSEGINYAYFLDRVYKYDNPIAAPISLRVIVPDGWQHKVYLSDLVVEDYNFCEDNVRTYFIIDQLLEDALTAQSGGIQLFHWKIDGVETLTTDFFADTTTVGGNPTTQWNFAKANLDGSERVSATNQQNTFNPFVDEFKLEYDTANSFHGGKPLGTINGNDYGVGIMEVGFDKPAILNGNLNVKKGCFFIDMDYSKSLLVKFDVIINQTSSNLFVQPTYKKTYFIEWNAQTCEKKFYYTTKDGEVDEIHNGFLSGLTGVEINETIVGCDESFAPTGNQGNFSYVLDFGTGVGLAGINYNAYSVPDRFIIEWNGQTFDSGFVGSSTYNQQLINAGVNPADINTASPSNGSGTLTFQKTSQFPTTATITVLAPLGGTGWLVEGICPSGNVQGELVEVGKALCGNNPSNWLGVYIDTPDPSNYVPTVGDIIYSDINLTTPYNGNDDHHRMRVTNPPFQQVLDYQFEVASNGLITSVQQCVTVIPPSLTQTSNTNTGPGGTRTQVFQVGNSVSAGNRFNLTVYSYTNTVVAVQGDTPQSIATKLRNAINNTTNAQWNSQGSAPTGANGFPPSATSSGANVTIQLNFQNQFAGNATVN